ncbi:MAG: hypothetical protein K0V04_28615 [Deltaproteobacteria bacterium]|nr:hypothetical protein [Deltaproteobacteria bacterium]
MTTYYRTGYTTFQEFQREALSGSCSHHESLGKEELELLQELEADDLFDQRPRRPVMNRWD